MTGFLVVCALLAFVVVAWILLPGDEEDDDYDDWGPR